MPDLSALGFGRKARRRLISADRYTPLRTRIGSGETDLAAAAQNEAR